MTNLTYCPDDGVEVELTGIDGEPLFNDDGSPMTITVLGADSDIGVKARNEDQDLRFKQLSRGVGMTAALMQTGAIRYLTKMTATWNITPSKLVPGVDPGLGEGKVPFSAAAAAKVYGHPKLKVIYDQPDTAINERARFMRASPAT